MDAQTEDMLDIPAFLRRNPDGSVSDVRPTPEEIACGENAIVTAAVTADDVVAKQAQYRAAHEAEQARKTTQRLNKLHNDHGGRTYNRKTKEWE